MRILIANTVAIAAVVAISASAEEPVTGPRRAARASDADETTDEMWTHLRTRAPGGKTTTGAIDGGARWAKG